MLDSIVALLLGVGIGTITGLLPGLHPNSLFVALIALFSAITKIALLPVMVFIVALSVAHTFLSFIPSLFFGAPDAETSLSILPGHRLLLQGRGYEALYLTVIGGVGVTLLAVASFPLLLYILPVIFSLIKPALHYILAGLALWMIFTDRSPLSAGIIFLCAGIVGTITLNRLPSGLVLFPALTGLFGISQLIHSLTQSTNIPPQTNTIPRQQPMIRGIVTGYIAGLFAALFPGIGSAQASILSSTLFRSKTKNFLVSLGGINTANILFTFVMFYALNKTRSGAVWTLSQLTTQLVFSDLIVLVVVGLASCFLSALLTLFLGKRILPLFQKLNYQKITLITLGGLVVLLVLFSGVLGAFIAATATALGLVAIRLQTRRVHLMGFLVFTTILYFSGFSPTVLHLFSI